MFDFREGWVVAHLDTPDWFDQLEPAATAALHNALVLLYRLADVDLIREHLRTLLPSPQDHLDVTEHGLAIWPADRQGPPLQVNLRLSLEVEEPSTEDVLHWDPSRVVFSERPLLRDACTQSWDAKNNGHPPPLLLEDVRVMSTPRMNGSNGATQPANQSDDPSAPRAS